MGDTLHFQAIVSVGTRIYYDGLSFPQGPVYYTVTAVMRHKDSLRVESERSNIVLVEFGTYPRPAKGILSGNVTDDSTGAPLRGALLRFARVSASGDKMIDNAVAITDSLGVYRAILDTGGYVVHAEMPTPLLILSPMIHPPPIIGGYRAEWFDDVTERALATPVLVTHDDAARADFGLTRLHPPIRPTGTVAGTVTDDSTHLPVAGAVVRFYCRSLANGIAPVVFTDSLGHYSARLDTGTYLLRTEAPLSRTSHLQYTAEWFDDVSEASAATPLAVVSGSILTADVGLSRPAPPVPAILSGIVTDTLGVPLRRATVVIMRSIQEMTANAVRSGFGDNAATEAFDIDGIGHCRGVIWKGSTDSLGRYSATVIAGRPYIALAAKWGYLPEYYKEEPNPLLAEILVPHGTVHDVDFTLAPNPQLQNSISGVIIDSNGTGVPSRIVLLPVHPLTFRRASRFTHTDPTGRYTVADVRSGSYFVLAVPFSGYAPAFYKAGAFGVTRWQWADTVVASGDVTGIDIGVLPIKAAGVTTVSGRVTAEGGALEGVRVFALSAQGEVVGFGVTDPAGLYALEGVPQGAATLVFDRDGYASGQTSILVGPATFTVSGMDQSLTSLTDVGEQAMGAPSSYDLGQNYPNPFNPATNIRVHLAAAGTVTLRVYDVLGREVTTLLNEPRAAGQFTVTWDGRDGVGKAVASGIYFYRLSAATASGRVLFTQTRKMALLK
jgi:hypothetical protein